VHQRAVVAEALRLRDEEGLGAVRVARRLGLAVGTVRDWHAGKLPRHSRRMPSGELIHAACPVCGQDEHLFERLPPAYAYALGLYLGDGSIVWGPRDVFRLRITLDKRYPLIVMEAKLALDELLPENRIGLVIRAHGCVDVSAYSRSLPCLFPQHGRGPKHKRRIFLSAWQQELAERWPWQLLRGLFQSDGHRFVNTGRGGWRHPRYCFSNVSTDITSIFCTACDKLGLNWTAAFPRDETKAVRIYVSRKDDVARMDEFVGSKA
jgi:hypothetical protein